MSLSFKPKAVTTVSESEDDMPAGQQLPAKDLGLGKSTPSTGGKAELKATSAKSRKVTTKSSNRMARKVKKQNMVKKFTFKVRGNQLKAIPAHGWCMHGSRAQSFCSMSLDLTKVQPLKMRVVSEATASGMKPNGAKVFVGQKVFKGYSTIRCFSATTRVARNVEQISTRGATDLANQIRLSESYKAAVDAADLPAGKYLCPLAAEYISGLPLEWTNGQPGTVKRAAVDALWPQAETGRAIPSISLFSGIGGLDLALRRWFEVTAFVEKSEYCQQVLRARMQEGNLPNVPICDDVLVFKAEGRAKDAEITVGGFPCQGLSGAGSQKGLRDARSALIKAMFAVYDAGDKMQGLFIENVWALLSKQRSCRQLLAFIFKECGKRGLDIFWTSNSVFECGFPMNRKRVFLLCAKPSFAKRLFKDLPQYAKPGVWNPGNEVPKVHWLKARPEARDQARLHALGNIVIPQQAKMAMSCFQSLMERAHECQANN